jgi:hypothetical protein
VAEVLDRLREMGAHEQVAVLLARNPAAHIALDNPTAVAALRDKLREMGKQEQATALVDGLPAAGHSDQFLTFGSHPEQLRFGREPDGIPAVPWSWEDLE